MSWLGFANDVRLSNAPQSGPSELIRDLGDGAYSEARRSEREALDLETPAHWRRVALIVARMTGKRVRVDTATRILENGGASALVSQFGNLED